MLINRTNLLNTTVAFNTTFNNAFAGYTPTWSRVAMEVSSSTKTNDYRWLGLLPKMREWLGARVVKNLEEAGYQVTNKSYENTVGVDRDDFEDDQIGIYTPMIADLGQSAAELPDQLIFSTLLAGAFSTVCYDGQYFCDTDHPVADANGVSQSVSNSAGGSGSAWFLMCTKRPVKPLIFQNRKSAQFVSLTNPDDPNVFSQKKFLYGVDMRCNAGYGLWQLVYGSKLTLNATNYAAARAAMMSMTGDNGRPLGLVPDLLVCAATNEDPARRLLNGELDNGGGSNPWKGTADLLVSSLLT